MHLFVHVFFLGGSCDDGVIFVLLHGTQMTNKKITWNAIQVQFHSILEVLVTNLISILCWMPKTEKTCVSLILRNVFCKNQVCLLVLDHGSWPLDLIPWPPGLAFYWLTLPLKFHKIVPGSHERAKNYHFFPTNQRLASTKIYSLIRYVISNNRNHLVGNKRKFMELFEHWISL